MKEGRIFEYVVDDIPIFRSLFEVLSGFLTDLVLTHIKSPDDVGTIKEITDKEESESEDEISNVSEESEEESDFVDTSDEEDVKKKSKSSKKKNVKKSKKDIKPKKSSTKDSKKSKKDETSTEIQKNSDAKDGGIRILQWNENDLILVHIRLWAHCFDKFECKYDSYSIGIEPLSVHEKLKTVDKDGIMTIYVNENNPHLLCFDVQNSLTGRNTSHTLKLQDPDEQNKPLKKPKFDILVEMKTEDFNTVCKSLITSGQYMIIECSEKRIEFICRGNNGDSVEYFENGKGVTITLPEDHKKSDGPKIVREMFDLNNIVQFHKCKVMSPTIQLLLCNKFPMFIRYQVAKYGTMTIGFSPVDENLLNKNMNYDEKFDEYYEETKKPIKYRNKDDQ
jgi:proliferating cell nuclear antigen PCNA